MLFKGLNKHLRGIRMSAMCKYVIAFAVISVSFMSAPSLIVAQQPSLIQQIEELKPSIVRIKARNTEIFQSQRPQAAIDRQTGRIIVFRNVHSGSYNRFGAGVFVDACGIIVTNAHTINNADQIRVLLNDNIELPARVVFLFKDMDFGFLKVDLPYAIRPVPLADSDDIHLGDDIVNIGNSELLHQTVSGGQIIGIGSSRTQKTQGRQNTYLIQTTVNLYPGDSGGPVFNRSGKLIGLITAKETSSEHSSFAIPSNIINRFLQEYLHGFEQ